MLRNINIQVLEDIEDYILLKGFPSSTSKSSISKKIQDQLDTDRHFEFWLSGEAEEAAAAGKDAKAEGKDADPNSIERGKMEDKKRAFITKFRPDRPKEDTIPIWNFIEEGQAKTPHVLRPEVQPHKSYEDGRVEKLLDLIEELGVHLKGFNQSNWQLLNEYTYAIFEKTDSDRKEAYEAKKNASKE